jgi:hypothetical protein
MALIMMALTGSLLTGCYEENGLDVQKPDSVDPVPAATYSIVGSIIWSQGTPADYTVSSSAGKVQKADGTFTISGLSADVTVTVTVSADKYKELKKSVYIAAAEEGQSVVYPLSFIMTYDAAEYTTPEYNLITKAFDGNTYEDLTEYAKFAVIAGGTSAPIADITALPGGTYVVITTAPGYTPTTLVVTLPTTPVLADTYDGPIDYPLNVSLFKTKQSSVALTLSTKIGTTAVKVQEAKLFTSDGTTEYPFSHFSNNNTEYTFLVPEADFMYSEAAATRAQYEYFRGKLVITDESGATIEVPVSVKRVNPEDLPNEEGEVNIAVDASTPLEVTLELVGTEPGLSLENVVTFTDIVNGTDLEKSYKYTTTVREGAVRIEEPKLEYGDVINKAVEAAIAELDEEIGLPYDKEVDFTTTIKLPAYTMLTTVTTTQTFVKMNLKAVVTISGDNEAVLEIPFVNATSNGGTIVVTPDWEKVTHEHGHAHDNSHGHGHGSGNAGGGIVEPE